MYKRFQINSFFSISFENNKRLFYIIPTVSICEYRKFHIVFRFGTICVSLMLGKPVEITKEEFISQLKDMLN